MINNGDKQQEIFNRVDIISAFERYIGGAGNINSKGFCKCPFHNEKTASFKIFKSNNSFYCFGCGTGGNVINLVLKALNISYCEAMKRLDADYNLELFKKTCKTDVQRAKEAAVLARKRMESEKRLEIKKEQYFKLTDFFKELREMPQNKAVRHDIEYIERLLDKWILYDTEPFERVPDDFNADDLINALKTKYGKGADYGE